MFFYLCLHLATNIDNAVTDFCDDLRVFFMIVRSLQALV